MALSVSAVTCDEPGIRKALELADTIRVIFEGLGAPRGVLGAVGTLQKVAQKKDLSKSDCETLQEAAGRLIDFLT